MPSYPKGTRQWAEAQLLMLETMQASKSLRQKNTSQDMQVARTKLAQKREKYSPKNGWYEVSIA